MRLARSPDLPRYYSEQWSRTNSPDDRGPNSLSRTFAHRTALRLFGGRKRMRASQLPMLALMVAYTMPSLRIIAQPTVQ